VVKAKGSWVTEDTRAKEIIEYSPPPPPDTHTHPDLDVDVCLPAGEIYKYSSCTSLQTFFIAFHSRL